MEKSGNTSLGCLPQRLQLFQHLICLIGVQTTKRCLVYQHCHSTPQRSPTAETPISIRWERTGGSEGAGNAPNACEHVYVVLAAVVVDAVVAVDGAIAVDFGRECKYGHCA